MFPLDVCENCLLTIIKENLVSQILTRAHGGKLDVIHIDILVLLTNCHWEGIDTLLPLCVTLVE